MKLISYLIRWSADIKHSRGILLATLIAGVVGGIANAALIALINSALNKSEPSGGALAWSFLAVCAVLPAARFVSQALIIRLTAATLFELRMQLSRNILSTPLRNLEQLGAHRLLTALTEDVAAITGAFISLPIICMYCVIVVATLSYMAWLSWGLLLGVFAFMVVAILTYQLMVTRGLRSFQLAREEWDKLFKHFQALTEGTKELKLHGERRRAFLSDALHSTAMTMRRLNTSGNTFYAIAGVWGQTLAFVLIGLLIFAAPSVKAVERSVLTGYVLALVYILGPLEAILNTLPILSRAAISARKIENLGLSLAAQHDGVEESAKAGTQPAFESLELVDVTHTYYREGKEENFPLGPVTLSFGPGRLVFIVGGNGSGKTTLAKLLVGLYMPESGEVRHNGRPVTEETREQYRQLFSVVFSDYYLFESLFGLDPSELKEKLHVYLKQLQLEHKLEIKDGTFSTTALSQGQRKRLALLTAYLEDRPIYVFDEWAADQDPVFKKIFYLQMLPELKARGKLVIVISHDDTYYHVADRLIKLDYGKVVSDLTLPPTADGGGIPISFESAQPVSAPTVNP
jgi:putative ATP-binding cassette transporter